MGESFVNEVIRDAAREIALGVLLRFGKLNELTKEQQIQLDSDTQQVAEVVMKDALGPFLDQIES